METDGKYTRSTGTKSKAKKTRLLTEQVKMVNFSATFNDVAQFNPYAFHGQD